MIHTIEPVSPYLHKLLHSGGYTLSTLASELDVSEMTVRNWLTAKVHSPSSKNFARVMGLYCQVFYVNASEH